MLPICLYGCWSIDYYVKKAKSVLCVVKFIINLYECPTVGENWETFVYHYDDKLVNAIKKVLPSVLIRGSWFHFIKVFYNIFLMVYFNFRCK